MGLGSSTCSELMEMAKTPISLNMEGSWELKGETEARERQREARAEYSMDLDMRPLEESRVD